MVRLFFTKAKIIQIKQIRDTYFAKRLDLILSRFRTFVQKKHRVYNFTFLFYFLAVGDDRREPEAIPEVSENRTWPFSYFIYLFLNLKFIFGGDSCSWLNEQIEMQIGTFLISPKFGRSIDAKPIFSYAAR